MTHPIVTAILILWLPVAFLVAHIFGRIAARQADDDSFSPTVPYSKLCHVDNFSQAIAL